jgi:hypothetical protein
MAPFVGGVSRAQSAIYAGGACCYEEPQHCVSPGAGRALTIDGVRVEPTGETEWERIAAAEHTSVASFARASLELLALGAPATLIEDTHRAAIDELAHARIARELACVPAHFPPIPAATGPAERPTFESFVRATFRDACVEETLGAVMMRERATRHEALASVADDEERHAELAWRTLAWAVRAGGEPARRALCDELDVLAHQRGTIVDSIIAPCARALTQGVAV